MNYSQTDLVSLRRVHKVLVLIFLVTVGQNGQKNDTAFPFLWSGEFLEGIQMTRDVSESEDQMEVQPDRWADTLLKAGGGLQPFPADLVQDDEEEEAEPACFRGSPPSAAVAGRMSRGCGTGRGFWVFFLRHREKQNIWNT